MVRKLRFAAVGTVTAAAVVAAALWGAYLAMRQVRPFYQQALQLDREVLERGNREMESRATALYTDARQAGTWHALFTDEQINGWLAVQLADRPTSDHEALTEAVHEPRIAISPDLLTLGFTTTRSGVDTVVSVEASVFLTEEGDVAIRLLNVRAGALPLPVTLVADQIAAACQELSLPVLWTRQDDCPVAMIEIRNDDTADGRRLFLDSIELHPGELYVAGHTELAAPQIDVAGGAAVDSSEAASARGAAVPTHPNPSVPLDEYELRLSPGDERSMLEIARKPNGSSSRESHQSNR